MSSREATKGTEIAALEAERNELEVRAEGALLGERRAAIARLAMVLMFGLVSSLGSPNPDPMPMYLGIGYTAYSLAVLFTLYRVRRPRPAIARVLPLLTTTVDYAFVTSEALLSTSFDGFHPGQHAVSTALVMSFAVARFSLWHVVYALACVAIAALGATWWLLPDAPASGRVTTASIVGASSSVRPTA